MNGDAGEVAYFELLSSNFTGAGSAARLRANTTVSSLDLVGEGTTPVRILTGGTNVRLEVDSTGVIEINSLPLPTTLSSIASIDLTTTGTTSLYTVPTGRSAIITAVIIRPTTATAANADGAISVGTNASTYDDIIANTTLTGLDSTTEHYVATPGGVSHTAAAAEVITFQVDTAETGTALIVTVDVIGYLL
jgi:hypothetical protein